MARQLSSIKEEEDKNGETNLLGSETLLFSLSASNTLKRDYKNRKVGTPYYLAPELWLTETSNLCSKQSDIWSLGVILYELCTMRKPFEAGDTDTLRQKVLKEKYKPLPLSVSSVFSDLISKCLQKKPEKRPLIEDIIANDTFQLKAKQLKIKIPQIVTISSVIVPQEQKTKPAVKKEEAPQALEKKLGSSSSVKNIHSEMKTPLQSKKLSEGEPASASRVLAIPSLGKKVNSLHEDVPEEELKSG